MPINFSITNLVNKLTLRLQEKLPGPSAHNVMRAVPVGSEIPTFNHQTPPKSASVLILFYPDQNEIFFPLIQRNIYKGVHSGQISLPGGTAEPGETSIATALREAEEEIGILASDVTVVGRLSEFYVIPSNFNVAPIIGFTQSKPEFKRDPNEVEKIIFGNVSHLLSVDAIKRKEILAAGRYALMAPHFDMDGHLVWGATAMILNELRTVLREK
jgi:8-oxo-dGTP pyrophosphatase MutT (NUDIX family)